MKQRNAVALKGRHPNRVLPLLGPVFPFNAELVLMPLLLRGDCVLEPGTKFGRRVDDLLAGRFFDDVK